MHVLLYGTSFSPATSQRERFAGLGWNVIKYPVWFITHQSWCLLSRTLHYSISLLYFWTLFLSCVGLPVPR